MFATLQGGLFTVFAFSAFHTQDNLFGSFSLLSEDGLSLTTNTLLFSVVTTSTLGTFALLGFLVLGDFVQFVALALLTEGATLFWYVFANVTFVSANRLLTFLPLWSVWIPRNTSISL